MFESEDEIADMWEDQELKPTAERKSKKANIFNQRQQIQRKMTKSKNQEDLVKSNVQEESLAMKKLKNKVAKDDDQVADESNAILQMFKANLTAKVHDKEVKAEVKNKLANFFVGNLKQKAQTTEHEINPSDPIESQILQQVKYLVESQKNQQKQNEQINKKLDKLEQEIKAMKTL